MYYGEFNNKDDVFGNFSVPEAERNKIHIILASYDIDGYDGSAMVLFIRDGKFWLVTGGHCSCYGLEDQWSPEQLTLEELRHYGEKSEGGVFQGLNAEMLKIVDRVERMDASGKTDTEIEFYLKLALGWN